jgi:hypothetical protein
MRTHSHNIISIHVNCGARLCVVGTLIHAVCAVCAAVCGNVHSIVRLFSGAVVCVVDSPEVVSIFSNKFKTYLFKFV